MLGATVPSISVDEHGSVSSYNSYDQNDTADNQLGLNDWDDSRSSASDTFSQGGDDTFGNVPRSNTMSRSGTVRKSMNRWEYLLFIYYVCMIC